MDPEEGLEAAKEPVYEFPSDLKTLGRSDPLVFVKADDVVGIHPSRIFSPLLLLVQEAPIHAFSIYLIRTVRTCDIDKSFRDLITPEDICDDVAHCTVALCCAIDDLIDCHISSLSFLYLLICCEIFSSSLVPGAKFRLLAIRAIWLMLVAIPRSCCSKDANVELISFSTAVCSDGMMAMPVIALITKACCDTPVCASLLQSMAYSSSVIRIVIALFLFRICSSFRGRILARYYAKGICYSHYKGDQWNPYRNHPDEKSCTQYRGSKGAQPTGKFVTRLAALRNLPDNRWRHSSIGVRHRLSV